MSEARMIVTRDPPHLNLVTLGAPGHGKTTLTAAISRVFGRFRLNTYGRDPAYSPEKLERLARSPGFHNHIWEGPPIQAVSVPSKTGGREYSHLDCANSEGYAAGLISGAFEADGGILVVSLTDGPTSQTRQQLLLAQQVGLPAIVVFLNKADLVDDLELMTVVELETRELLSQHGFSGVDTPVIVGSATQALEGDGNEIGVPSVQWLMETVGDIMQEPEQAWDRRQLPFRIQIEDVKTQDGRGMAVMGRGQCGVLKVGEYVEIVGIRQGTQVAIATGVEMFGKRLNLVWPGDKVSIFLQGEEIGDTERGQWLTEPRSATTQKRFSGLIYAQRQPDSWPAAIFQGSNAVFVFGVAEVEGNLQFAGGQGAVLLGESAPVTVELQQPVVLERGTRFTFKQEGRNAGLGIVTEALKTSAAGQ